MEIIYSTLVGSKMHGLDTPSSDEDVRYITKPSLRDIVSPFRNDKIKVRDSAGDDIESWDIAHFVRHLTQGNPTTYEVIKSPLYDKTLPNSEAIRSLMPLCFDGVKIMYAHIGYAEAQLKRYLRKAEHDLSVGSSTSALLLGVPKYEMKEGNLVRDGVWEENHIHRIPKSIVAAYRVIAQGVQLLKTGDFCPVIKDYDPNLHTKLMDIKLMDANTIHYNFINEHLGGIESDIQRFKTVFEGLPDSVKNQKPNIEGIEDILCGIYGI